MPWPARKHEPRIKTILLKSGENFLYGFKGARSAPRTVTARSPQREELQPERAPLAADARRGVRFAPAGIRGQRAGSSALAPYGARRAAARARPRDNARHRLVAATPPVAHPAQGAVILPAFCLEPVKITIQP